MKTVITIVTYLILSLPVFAQTAKSNIVYIDIPNGAIELSKEQATKTIHTNFKRSSIPLDVDNHYQFGGIIISFWDYHENTSHKQSLEETRSGMLGILKITHDTVNVSKIIKINDMQFLVYEYQKENEVHLVFQTDFNKGAKFCGMLEFKKPDEEKAQSVLNEILQSIHFKN